MGCRPHGAVAVIVVLEARRADELDVRRGRRTRMDLAGVEDWIRGYVEPTGPIETTHDRPWATVLRVPLDDGVVWFKACAQVQAFEPRLTAQLFTRWPDRVAEVIAHDQARGWMLLGDAGSQVGVPNNSPEVWLAVLPAYAELQRGEAPHAQEHLTHGVPDLRVAAMPSGYRDLLRDDLPLDGAEIGRLRSFETRFAELCNGLTAPGIPETVQHDDLHANNLHLDGTRLRVLDWGDASISHPFASLVVTFRFLEETNGLQPGDPWFPRLRDAYLEPWGEGFADVFALAMRVGTFAHAIAWTRQRNALPLDERPGFDTTFAIILRRAVAWTAEP
jgi:hypothetical protein